MTLLWKGGTWCAAVFLAGGACQYMPSPESDTDDRLATMVTSIIVSVVVSVLVTAALGSRR